MSLREAGSYNAMKIQSGRIQSVGINPNNGRSLGFVEGLGQSDLSNLVIDPNAPAQTGTPGVTVTSNPQTTADVTSYLDSLLAPSESALPTTTTATQPFQWGAFVMGLGALFFVVVLAKKK
jgi:hypothetical protein